MKRILSIRNRTDAGKTGKRLYFLYPNDRKSCEQGAVLAALLWLIGIIVLFVSLIFFVFGQIVWPDTIGLRENFFGIPGVLKEGYDERGLSPGLHWKIPGFSTIHLIPRGFQFVNLNNNPQGGDLDLNQLEIPTTDGSKVKTDITLILRYFDTVGAAPRVVEEANEDAEERKGKVPFVSFREVAHGGPKQLVNTYTLDSDKQLRTFAKKGEDFLKRALSNLSTTDYYNPVVREKAALHANETINQVVNKDGIELWATLIRRYVYSEKNIDDQIFAKNLQEQTERLNAAQSALAEAKAETEQTRAEWDAKIKVLNVEGTSQVRVIRSEAELYKKQKTAEGDKLVEIAIAEIEREKNNAYASPGGDIYVARRMLPILSALRGGVVADIDPFDIGSWIEKLLAKGRKGAARQYKSESSE